VNKIEELKTERDRIISTHTKNEYKQECSQKGRYHRVRTNLLMPKKPYFLHHDEVQNAFNVSKYINIFKYFVLSNRRFLSQNNEIHQQFIYYRHMYTDSNKAW